jgi:hypothetical protein
MKKRNFKHRRTYLIKNLYYCYIILLPVDYLFDVLTLTHESDTRYNYIEEVYIKEKSKRKTKLFQAEFDFSLFTM